MSKEIKYPEEVKEAGWNRVLGLFKELPKPNKRKTNNIGW